jgi:hypothetical protein
MSEEKSLTVLTPEDLSTTLSLGDVLAKSGFFSDSRSAAQAVVKVLAGREMGFGPIASMMGVHIIQGKPSTGANLIAAAVKGSRRYDYHVKELTDHTCTIIFLQGGKAIGESTFTMEDAKRAGLTGKDNWAKFPRNMLFSRCMSNGARWFCPDVFGGVTPYTPEELGAEVILNEDGDVIDVTPTQAPAPAEQKPAEKPQATPGNGNMAKLLTTVNQVTSGYYNHAAHLLNALKLELGDDLALPEADDRDGWNRLYQTAVAYAKKEAA